MRLVYADFNLAFELKENEAIEICKTMKEANAQHKEFEKLVSF